MRMLRNRFQLQPVGRPVTLLLSAHRRRLRPSNYVMRRKDDDVVAAAAAAEVAVGRDDRFLACVGRRRHPFRLSSCNHARHLSIRRQIDEIHEDECVD